MKKRWFYIPAGAIILILLLVGTFCDLSISKAFANPSSFLAHLITGATGYPLAFAAAFFGTTFIKLANKKEYDKTWQNVLLIVFGSIAILGSILVLGYPMTSYLAFKMNRLLSLPIGLLATIPGCIVGWMLFEKIYNKRFIQNVVFVAVTIGVILAISFLFKFVGPRARFTSVRELGDNYFRPWYLPNLTKEMLETLKNSSIGSQEAQSFPSSHSATAFSITVILTAFPLFNDKFKGKEPILFFIGFTYFLLIALVRIRCGAHYLSDTMFAGMISLAIFIIANEIYIFKEKEKKI